MRTEDRNELVIEDTKTDHRPSHMRTEDRIIEMNWSLKTVRQTTDRPHMRTEDRNELVIEDTKTDHRPSTYEN